MIFLELKRKADRDVVGMDAMPLGNQLRCGHGHARPREQRRELAGAELRVPGNDGT